MSAFRQVIAGIASTESINQNVAEAVEEGLPWRVVDKIHERDGHNLHADIGGDELGLVDKLCARNGLDKVVCGHFSRPAHAAVIG